MKKHMKKESKQTRKLKNQERKGRARRREEIRK